MLVVHLQLEYDFGSENLDVFGSLLAAVKTLKELGVETNVIVRGVDAPPRAPPANVNAPKPRGRPPGNGKTKPAAAAAVEDDLNSDPGEADDPLADELADEGVPEGSMSPTEARDRGLVSVRTIYNAGFKREVKALQAQFQVAKFADVPPARGHEFFTAVMALAEKTKVAV
jgi:hypothetical protein